MAALDLIGRHWALQIVWELSAENLGFRELQQRCKGISPTVLSRRLKELRTARVVETEPSGKNALTPLGADLFLSIGALKNWSRIWADSLMNERSDPGTEQFAKLTKL